MEKYWESKHNTRFVRLKKVLVYGVLSCLVLLLIVYGMACWSIRSGVRAICAEATQEYPGDRVEALIAYVNSEDHSLKEKNRVVWALGQLGDRRALPVLEKSYTGQPCNHDKSLCQRELQRVIKLCKGGLNLTAWLPR